MKCSSVNPSEGTSSITSSHLLRAAQADNQDAWRELVQNYSRRMYRWCRLAGLQPADAANVVQDALGAVARKLVDFRRDRPGATFRGWLRRIVDNKIRDHFRRLGRQLDVPAGGTDAQLRLVDVAVGDGECPGSDVTSGRPLTAEQTAMLDVVANARQQVGERDWKLFWRVAVDGQPAGEAGREFGVSANAVRLVKMRVLRRLRSQLGDRCPKPQ